MKNLHLRFGSVCGLLGLVAPMLAFAAGPAQPLYVTAGNNNVWFIIQGSTVTPFADAGSQEYAIAVGSTIRTLPFVQGLSGAEYTLTGTPTGNTYLNTLGSQMLDGTTDGTHNYSIQWNSGQVFAFSTTWTNPTLLFGGLPSDTIGITYDSANNTFWTANRAGNQVQNYSLTGTLLGGFTVAGGPTGIAYNPVDGTLWVMLQQLGNELQQYTTAGVLLNTMAVPQLAAVNALGMEFQEGASATPFSSMTVNPMVIDPYQFSLTANFGLAAGGPTFSPPTQAVTVQVGTFQLVIPAGSFQGSYGYTFAAKINGNYVTASIMPTGPGRYIFSVRGVWSGPVPATNPVSVTLTIGTFTGTTTDTWYY